MLISTLFFVLALDDWAVWIYNKTNLDCMLIPAETAAKRSIRMRRNKHEKATMEHHNGSGPGVEPAPKLGAGGVDSGGERPYNIC
jgi:hypothetical protein